VTFYEGLMNGIEAYRRIGRRCMGPLRRPCGRQVGNRHERPDAPGFGSWTTPTLVVTRGKYLRCYVTFQIPGRVGKAQGALITREREIAFANAFLQYQASRPS
jgi:hypothetical protein